tara:strand:- start:611 stop:1315 length:705 start_codon:yes stop_codon:yes gene_type:complete
VKQLNSIFIIPARKGSKGLLNKNVKNLFNKPLISYSIEYALKIKSKNDLICVTTNDKVVEKIANNYKDIIVIKRPDSFASDNSTMEIVINHALKFFKTKNLLFKSIVLLQPTSPIRKIQDFKNVKKMFRKDIDMVVSVRKGRENPYYLLFEENNFGYLEKSKKISINRRQDAPLVYCLNGSFFMINTKSLEKKSIENFSKIVKVEMPFERSVDIDDELDWDYLNFLIVKKNLLK